MLPFEGPFCRIDGDGMLHKTRIKDGNVSYQNRYVETYGLKEERLHGKRLWTGFFEKPDPKARQSPKGGSIYKNSSNTSVVFQANRLLSMYEGALPHRIRADDLETEELHDFEGSWEGPFVAHPKVDQKTGEMMFVSAHLPTGNYRYGVVDAQGKVSFSCNLDVQSRSLMHDMAVTENYSIIFDLPYNFDLKRMEKGIHPLGFDHELPSRFGVIPRHGGDVQWFEAPPSYIFHTLNAYEDGDQIVMLAPRLEKTNWLNRTKAFGLEEGEIAGGDWAGQLTEWRFDLHTGKVSEMPHDDTFVDFPQLPLDLVGQKSRYAYACRLYDQGGMDPVLFDGLIKYDHVKGTSEFTSFGNERYGHEVAAVPCPGAKEEDDCLLITYVHDEFNSQSELVMYHAQDLKGGPIARVILPQRVPYGFHGTWVPSQAFTD